MARKSEQQRREERRLAEERAWRNFSARLREVSTVVEAWDLLASSPPVDSPGRSYYSNLGFFLRYLSLPMGAGGSEVGQYLRLAAAFHAQGALTGETLERLKAAAAGRSEY